MAGIHFPVSPLPKESFLYPETQSLFQQLEEVSQRSGVSRGAAFEDFLGCTVAALGRPLMEEEYLETIEKHKAGRRGKRGVDTLAAMFGNLVKIMDETRVDVLGDLFQGAITYGERGQFMTPQPICDAVARMSLPEEKTGLDGRRTVADPCVGSGRMLLAASEVQPHWHFVGVDVDLRCVRMTAINLALRNLYGHAVWGNSLANEANSIYETGRVQVWGNAIRKVNRVPLPDREPEEIDLPIRPSPGDDAPEAPSSQPPSETSTPRSQLRLF